MKKKNTNTNNNTKVKKIELYSTILNSNKKNVNLSLFSRNMIQATIKELNNNTNKSLELINPQIVDFESKLNQFMSITKPQANNIKKKCIFDNLLLTQMLQNPTKSFSLREIKQEHDNKHPRMKFSISTLHRHITKEMKYRYGKVELVNKKVNSDKAMLMNLIYAEKLLKILVNKHTILYLDETSIAEKQLSKNFWIKKGQNVKRENSGRLKSLSIIGVISNNGLIHYNLIDGTYNSHNFKLFMEELNVSLNSNPNFAQKLKNAEVTVIMDNAKIHTSKSSRRSLRKGRINILYLPPYSPFFNPIEQLWGGLKKRKARRIFNNK